MRARLHKPQSDSINLNQNLLRRKVMPKLVKNKTGDPNEKEADRVANAIVKKTSSKNQGVSKENDTHAQLKEDELQTKDEKTAQTKENEKIQLNEEENIQTKVDEPEIQKKEDEQEILQPQSEAQKMIQKQDTDNFIDTSMETTLKARKGKGAPLEKNVKVEMESGFGTNFGDVRIHTDKEAQELAGKVGAQAFTYGNDIYFNSGKYNPASSEGKFLLAHELTHVLQQRNSPSLNLIQRHTVEDCNNEYYNVLIPACRKLTNKAQRALCYAAAATAYGACLASAEEVMAGIVMTAAIVAAAVLILADGPLPFGDAAAVAILASVGISL